MVDFILRHYIAFTQKDDEEGQGLVEYALIIALIAIVVIGALTLLGGAIGDILSQIAAAL
jgi:pilus assembly protein Flp/PilA